MKRQMEHSSLLPNATGAVELFLTALPDGGTRFRKVQKKERTALTALWPH
jgi:hypothetical protein